MTERELYIPQLRNTIASLETDSLFKCIRYVAAHRGLVLCGSARSYLSLSWGTSNRANIFYWLEYDAPMMWLDWLADTENFCKAIQSAA